MRKKTVGLMVRFDPRDHAMLKVAAKAYRSPSLNWFIGEMLACMLNPSRWQEFQLRLQSGQQQLVMAAVAEHTPRKKVRRVRTP